MRIENMTKLFLLMAGLFLIAAITCLVQSFELCDRVKAVNPEYANGVILDLPEELTAIDSVKTDMQAYRHGDTIFIYFK